MAITYTRSPLATGVDWDIRQPIEFSHRHHVKGLGLDCRYCHTSVETSASAGFPDSKTCYGCHSQVWDQTEKLKPVRDSFVEKKPLSWTRVNQLPDYVYFNHSIHIKKGVSCVTCHGDISQMPLVKQKRSFLMEDCLECHNSPQKYHVKPLPNTDCTVCHR